MKTSTLAIVLITLLCLPIKVNAQQDKFVIGAYMHSSPWGHTGYPSYHPQDSALFSLWRAKSLGINTAMVYVRQPDPDQNIFYEGIYPGAKPTNMEALRGFPNVIAMNTTSAYRLLDGTQPSPPNYAIRNFDYIFFYSGAYYSKWDATQSLIPIGVLGLKHDDNFGSKITFNGKEYWSSGTGHTEGLLVKGPNYNQETRYRCSGYPTMWDNEVQTYEVFFDMILKNTPLPSQLNDPMCEIMVYTKYTTDNFANTSYEKLASRILKVGEIGETGNQTLTYDFSTYCKNAFKSRIEQTEEGLCPPGTKQLIDVEFRVKYLNPAHELLIDFIEVYDVNIWKNMLSDQLGQTQARNNIANYLQKFKQVNPQFYSNNLKYFFGVDEPHTVDAYIPHSFVQSVLDSLNNDWPEGAPQLFTHLYPEWNGFRNGARVIDPFVETVKPKPFHFYYQPTNYEISTAYGLDNFRNIFYWVYEAIGSDDFWVSINVYDIPNHWLHWRGPTPTEMNASVMIALSHGAKGIFYEPFYSYNINTGGLLKWNPNDNPPYTPTATGEQVRDHINPRLSGILGNTLLKLKYSGNEICLRQAIDRDCSYSGSSYEYLTLYSDPMLGTSNKYDFNATFLFDPNDIENKYFMATNSLAVESKLLNAEIDYSSSEYENIRLRNIEGGFDITFKDIYNLSYNFPAGEGYLFQVAPVVKYGGKLVYNETVENGTTLYDDMTIENGAILKS